MKTFTFISATADRLIEDLNNGRIVRLTKASGNAIVLQHGNDIDEFGNYIYRFTIEPKDGESKVKNVPVNQDDIINLLLGEEFAEYGIVEK